MVVRACSTEPDTAWNMNLSFAGIAFWGGRGPSMAIDLCSLEDRKNEAGPRSLYAIQQATTRTATTAPMSTFHGRLNQGMRLACCMRIVASTAGCLGGDSQAVLNSLLGAAKPVHGPWGSGTLLTTSLFSMLMTGGEVYTIAGSSTGIAGNSATAVSGTSAQMNDPQALARFGQTKPSPPKPSASSSSQAWIPRRSTRMAARSLWAILSDALARN